MAIGHRASGSVAQGTSDPTAAPGAPTGQLAGDMLLMLVATKAATPPTVNPPAGWTLLGSVIGGAGSQGIDRGLIRMSVLWRQAAADGETMPTVDLSAAASPYIVKVHAYSKGAGDTWATPALATTADSAGSATSYDPPAAGTVLDLQAGDWLVAGDAINGDAGTATVPGALTVAGVTLTAVQSRGNDGSTQGQDARLISADTTYVSGTATAGPDRSVAYSGANSDMAGATVFVRLRVTAAGPSVTHTDQAGLTDTATPQISKAVTAADSTGLTDTTTPATDYRRAVAEQAGLTDSAAATAVHTATVTDQAGLSDTTATAAAKGITVAEQAGLTDTASPALTAAVTIADSSGLTDSAQPVAGYAPTLTDLAGLTDTTTAQLVKAAGATDSTGLTDTLARQASHVHTDQAGITDTAAAPLTAARTATDPAGLTDATSTELAKTITAVDTTGLTDQTSLHRSAGWADTTGLTDVTEGSAAYTRAVTDSTGLADSAAAQRLLLAEPMDSAGLTDTATAAATTGTAEQPVHIGLDTATTAGGQLDTTTTAAGGLDTTTTAAGMLD